MKKNDLFLAFSILVYSFLFYHQSAGINYLIFSLLQVVFFFLAHRENTKSLQWKIAATSVVLSGLSILLYGSVLAVVGNFISFSALAFLSISPGTSILLGLCHTIYSVVGSMVFVILDFIESKEQKEVGSDGSKRFKNVLIFIIALLVMFMFLGLYRSSNSIFKKFTDQIDLSFISGEWIGFTLMGFFLLYGFYRYRGIKELEDFDIRSSNNLSERSGPSFFDGLLSINSEKKAGTILFAMLNLLLLSVNIIDVIYLYGGTELPEGTSHSSMVHQGVNALVTSIIMAVAIILFFYRGRLNFIKDNKTIKKLTYLWILQNGFMIISTAYRNQLYIQEYFLTYKRIGVFVYLALCIIGLIYTLVKIRNVKSNWFIVRYVGWSFYVLLFIATMVNWDGIIINYNISKGKKNLEHLDIYYLLNLPSRNIPETYELLKTIDPALVENYSLEIENAIGELLLKKENIDWRSFTISDFLASEWLEHNYTNDQLESIKVAQSNRLNYLSNRVYYEEF